jgi:hypothetical protein
LILKKRASHWQVSKHKVRQALLLEIANAINAATSAISNLQHACNQNHDSGRER